MSEEASSTLQYDDGKWRLKPVLYFASCSVDSHVILQKQHVHNSKAWIFLHDT